ncbi:MAG: hypothetical protein HQ478_11390 [Chloroflexi bacterium]|nr:hypothetical protein [Chloroflexota bacterium]
MARSERTLGGGGPHPGYDQHFLTRESTARMLTELAGIEGTDLVYEFGAGEGMITRHLVQHARRVVAYELDSDLASDLQKIARWIPSLEIIQEDCRRLDRFDPGSILVANLPFGITSDIARKITVPGKSPRKSVVIVQKEAALKFAGRPDQTRFSLLAYPWFSIKVLQDLYAHEFSPPPGVVCSVMVITQRAEPLITKNESRNYGTFVKQVHSDGRADIRNSLKVVWSRQQIIRTLSELGIDPTMRASDLPPTHWISLFRRGHNSPH